MKLFSALVMLFISGCAGLSIKSLTTDEARDIHKANKSQKGYLVYHPLVLVEIVNKEVCLQKNNSGKCTSVQNICGFGQVSYIPNYEKPYKVNSKGGFGKAGVDIQIANGWMLSGFKDTSDNTALLSKILPDATEASFVGPTNGPCGKIGLYKLTDKMKLEKFFLFPVSTGNGQSGGAATQ